MSSMCYFKPISATGRMLGYAVMFVLFVVRSLTAQPGNVFLRTYDGGRVFYDVYIDSDHNVILAGDFIFRNPEDDEAYTLFRIVKVNPEDGAVIWDQIFPQGGELVSAAKTKTVIQTDQGNYVFGGHWCNRGNTLSTFVVVMITNDGDQVWLNLYGMEMTASSICNAVIETKGGMLLACGRSNRMPFAVMMDMEGNPTWERHYDGNDIPGGRHFAGLREIEGGFLMAAFGGQGTVLVKIDVAGDIIWSRNYGNGVPYALITCREGGYATCGHCGGFREGISDFILMKFDENGFREWWNHYDGGTQSYGLMQDRSNGYVIAGHTVPGHEGAIVRTDPAGNLIWNRVDAVLQGMHGLVEYYSIVTENGRDIFITGTYEHDGCLVKIHLESAIPEILSYSPESIDHTVLLDDSLRFSVVAEQGLGDTLRFNWFLEDSLVSEDSAKTITFNELGDFVVKCVVSGALPSDSVSWQVHVRELYIDTYIPGDLDTTLRRNSEVSYRITTRAVEGDPVNYLWTLTDLHTQRDTLLGETDSITALFTKAHDYQVEVIAYRNQASDAIQWLVHSCSTIWEWWPRELELTLPIEDTTEFEVWPFNPESDSLSVEWSLDGELFSDEWETDLVFAETGHHAVTVVVNDGCESDTLTWQVDAFDPDGVVGQAGIPLLPRELTLYPVYPNPFNAEATLRFYLPKPGDVTLELLDIHGRAAVIPVCGFILPESLSFISKHPIYLQGYTLPP